MVLLRRLHCWRLDDVVAFQAQLAPRQHSVTQLVAAGRDAPAAQVRWTGTSTSTSAAPSGPGCAQGWAAASALRGERCATAARSWRSCVYRTASQNRPQCCDLRLRPYQSGGPTSWATASGWAWTLTLQMWPEDGYA